MRARCACLCAACAGRPTPEANIAPGGSDTPIALRRRFAALDGLQMKYDTMEKVYEERLREMETEFLNAVEHVFDRRSAIVSGASEPTTDEVTCSSFETAHLVDAEVPTEGVSEGVPGFWATAIKQCLRAPHDKVTAAAEVGEEEEALQRFSERTEVLDYPDAHHAVGAACAAVHDVMSEEDAEAQGLTPEQLEQMDAEAGGRQPRAPSSNPPGRAGRARHVPLTRRARVGCAGRDGASRHLPLGQPFEAARGAV